MKKILALALCVTLIFALSIVAAAEEEEEILEEEEVIDEEYESPVSITNYSLYENSEDFYVSLVAPQFDSDLFDLSEINDILVTWADESVQQMQETLDNNLEWYAEEAAKKAEQAAENDEDYEEEDIFVPRYETIGFYDADVVGDYLSVRTELYQYLGGANGVTGVNCYNVNLTNGSILSLSDIFADGSDYASVLNAQISRYVENHPLKDQFTEAWIRDNQQYYFDGGQLTLQFQKYEIAPGYFGPVSIPIDFSAISGILQPSVKQSMAAGYMGTGKSLLKLNGQYIPFDHTLLDVKEGDTVVKYVPVRPVADLFGITMDWDVKARIASINGIEVTNGVPLSDGVTTLSAPVLNGDSAMYVNPELFSKLLELPLFMTYGDTPIIHVFAD